MSDFIKIREKNTQDEIERIKEYATLVELSEMQHMLAGIGLKLDLKTSGYFLPYYNTSNENHYREATTQCLDSDGIGCLNINSNWYKQNVLVETEKYVKLKELRNNYFCVVYYANRKHILSF